MSTPSEQSRNEDRRQRSVTRPLLVASMVTAFSVTLINIMARVAPDGPWIGFGIFIFLLSVEAVYTTEWLADIERLKLNRFAYRLAELVVILLLLRLFLWYEMDNWPRLGAIRQILLDPVSVLDPFFFVLALVAGLAWALSVAWGGLLRQLALSPAELDYYARPARERASRGDVPRDIDRSEVARDLARHWIIAGMALVFFAALGAYNLSTVEDGFSLGELRSIRQLGLPMPVLLALIVYFLIGFWTLSQARLASLRVRWLTGGTKMNPRLPRRWGRLSWLLLLVIAGLASLLPVGSTFALSYIVSALLFIGFQISAIFLFLFNILLALPFGLLMRLIDPGEGTAEIPPMATPPPPPAAAGEPSETFALAMGSLFWFIVIVAVVAALLFFLRERGYRIDVAWLSSGWRFLVSWLRGLWQQTGERAERLAAAIRQRQGVPHDGRKTPSWRFFRPGALPPREQVRYFYLSLVRRAGQKGLERRQGQTPLEYARTLGRAWPEAESDVEQLTGAFIEARYSRHEIEETQLGRIKAAWRRLRRIAKQSS